MRRFVLTYFYTVFCLFLFANHNVVSNTDRCWNAGKGLDGRVIALWPSHGLYYNAERDRWLWQRAPVMTTVEDKLTLSYVLNYLEPMLENAGAEVMMPRERDPQVHEIILEKQRMELKTTSSRQAEVKWSPDIPESGWYWVSVNYSYSRDAVSDATFEVHHDGGVTIYRVNQTRGYGTWIYLGRHYFREGSSVAVVMGNESHHDGVVVAPVVRFGGGIGASGERRIWECASEWLKSSGAPYSVYSPDNGANNYRDDLRCRPHWVNWLAGGSSQNRRQDGLEIPVDLAFALHTDAGVSLDNFIGTLAIYSSTSAKLKNNKYETRFPNGTNRNVSKRLATIVNTQIVSDIRRLIEPEWTSRNLSERRYYEVTYNCVPSLLVELLSHQNYNDMLYGLDPRFKFVVSRAIYKGILHYLVGPDAVVQPLPVNRLNAYVDDNSIVQLTWHPVLDSLEPSAAPSSYMVYRRLSDGGWDNGELVTDTFFCMKINVCEPVSFKVAAVNDGGRSMDSEVLTVAFPSNPKGRAVVVNCFDRVSAPQGFSLSGFAGFSSYADRGVDEYFDYDYIGGQVDFDVTHKWLSDDAAGWGHSLNDNQFTITVGNTHDNILPHAVALMNEGYIVCSASRDAFLSDAAIWRYRLIDLLFGKQRVTRNPRNECSFPIFDERLLSVMESAVDYGSNILISGSYVASDPFLDSLYTHIQLLRYANLIGAEWRTSKASQDGNVVSADRRESFRFCTTPDLVHYVAESVDAFEPLGHSSSVILRYSQNGLPAAVSCTHGKSRVVTVGFPLECLYDMSGLIHTIGF